MPARTVTRRSFLAGALSAGAAGGLTLPGRALALERGVARTIVRELWLGSLAAGTRAVNLGQNADLIGLEWRAPRGARVQVRFRGEDGRVTSWAMASACGCIWAISTASAREAASSSSVGTTRLTMPRFSASQASTGLAVNSSSLALRAPSSQVWP